MGLPVFSPLDHGHSYRRSGAATFCLSALIAFMLSTRRHCKDTNNSVYFGHLQRFFSYFFISPLLITPSPCRHGTNRPSTTPPSEHQPAAPKTTHPLYPLSTPSLGPLWVLSTPPSTPSLPLYPTKIFNFQFSTFNFPAPSLPLLYPITTLNT